MPPRCWIRACTLQIQDGRAVIMGVVRGSYRVRVEGAGNIVGVKCRSTGFHAFAQGNVREWTDRSVPAREVFDVENSWAGELSSAVFACCGDADAHAAITASRSDVRRMSDLVCVSGKSARTLDRLFARYVA
jgi:hypothetical protein